MICRKCGFVYKGEYTECPYCGEKTSYNNLLKKRVFAFNIVDIKIIDLLVLVAFNLLLVCIASDAVIADVYKNLHITPYAFALLYGPIFILDNLIINIKRSSKTLLKFVLLAFAFDLCFLFSYITDIRFVLKSLFCFYTPGFLLAGMLFLIIKDAVRRDVDLLTGAFAAVIVIVCASLNFGLSFIGALHVRDYLYQKLIINISFILSCMYAVNMCIIGVLKLRTRAFRENSK